MLGGHALYHTAAEGLHHFGVCAKLGVDPAKLNNWLLAVEKCMRPARGELPPALALPSPRAVFLFCSAPPICALTFRGAMVQR